MHVLSRLFLASLIVPVALGLSPNAQAQTGSIHEPVRYVSGVAVEQMVHEGYLRPAVGTASHQTFRANRTRPELAEGHGWTYNHASALCYWNGTFYQEYLSNPVDEHVQPGQTLLVSSKNGSDWEMPQVIFPPYEAPEGVEVPEGYYGYMMHQRMGFYVTSDDRLLLIAFYGHTEDPFLKGGIGRVGREMKKDGTMGPIHFIRYSSYTDWNESNTSFPFYKRSKDKGFVKACEELLGNIMVTRQWFDEDEGLDGFYKRKGSKPIENAYEALSYYHRKDGAIVGLFKRSWATISYDEGKTFSPAVKVPTFTMAGGKVWGQRTDDDRYAIVHNPTLHDEHRYPLIIVTGDDGIVFDDMLIVQGEVPPRRFFGRWKDYGPCYVRGITEGNGNPPGDDLWLTYSMNKEDMWVSRVPVPVRYAVDTDVNDSFNNMATNGHVHDWNIYDPKWANVDIVEFPSTTNKSLRLQDSDPHDYARAVRVFPETNNLNVSAKVLPKQNDHGTLEIEVVDRYGFRPVRIRFDEDGWIKATDGHDEKKLAQYKNDEWVKIDINLDATLYGTYTVKLNNKVVLKEAKLAVAIKSVERLSFRTGEYRNLPTRKTNNEKLGQDPVWPDDPEKNAVFYLDDVVTVTK